MDEVRFVIAAEITSSRRRWSASVRDLPFQFGVFRHGSTTKTELAMVDISVPGNEGVRDTTSFSVFRPTCLLLPDRDFFAIVIQPRSTIPLLDMRSNTCTRHARIRGAIRSHGASD